jgi:epoxyqueuosine reductase QueG
MELKTGSMELNEKWARRILDSGADFVYFVDISMLPVDITIEEYACAVLFGKALSKAYISALITGEEPKTKEFYNTERKMDALAVKLAGQLETEGYKSIAKLKSGRLPHKTVALRAGLGFIGKNNLLVTDQYGCALTLGKVLTTAPFAATSETPKEPRCGGCNICVDACPTKALLGKTWSVTTTRDEMMVRKNCTLCLKCLIMCPYTAEYIK